MTLIVKMAQVYTQPSPHNKQRKRDLLQSSERLLLESKKNLEIFAEVVVETRGTIKPPK